MQCKLPLSIADGLLIIDEHKSGSFQILGVEVAGGVDAIIRSLLRCARTTLLFSHINCLCSFKYFLKLTVLDSPKSYRKIFGDDATDLPTIS